MSGTSKGGGSVKKPDVDKNPDKGDIVLLWQPKDGKANVDIVFVHGVGGDKIGTWTWTQRPKDPDNPREDQVWPKDFLPEVLPSARILSFGYNADFAKFYPEERAKIAPNLTIDNYSTELLDKLSGLRQGEESNRPIIFVAHSMGGLVVANALSQAQTLEKGSVADQTIGAIFLGTPFEGSSLASYGSFGVRFLKYVMRVQPDNLKTLEQKSEKLADLNQNFARFLTTRYKDHDKPRLEIACYFEQLPTSVPLLGEIFVVPETSARWMGITPLSIEANHTGMCRFDLRQRSGYKSISEKMSQWVTAYQKNPNKGGVGGVDGKGISINVSGDIDYSNAEISGIATGHLTTTTPKGINITQNNDSKRSKRSRKTRKKRDSDDSNDSDSE